jgi:hypothetical protein
VLPHSFPVSVAAAAIALDVDSLAAGNGENIIARFP